jgi:hypothetical protein
VPLSEGQPTADLSGSRHAQDALANPESSADAGAKAKDNDIAVATARIRMILLRSMEANGSVTFWFGEAGSSSGSPPGLVAVSENNRATTYEGFVDLTAALSSKSR